VQYSSEAPIYKPSIMPVCDDAQSILLYALYTVLLHIHAAVDPELTMCIAHIDVYKANMFNLT
jgi:hypothetical protein